MGAAADGGEIDGAAEARLDQRPYDQIAIGHAIFGKEAEAEPGLDHPLHPIVAHRAEHLPHADAAVEQGLPHRLEYLAIGAGDISLAVEVLAVDDVLPGQAVVGGQDDDEAFVEDRKLVEIFGKLVGNADDGDLELALL